MTCAECKKFRSKQIIQNYYENKEECQKSYQQGRADQEEEIEQLLSELPTVNGYIDSAYLWNKWEKLKGTE